MLTRRKPLAIGFALMLVGASCSGSDEAANIDTAFDGPTEALATGPAVASFQAVHERLEFPEDDLYLAIPDCPLDIDSDGLFIDAFGDQETGPAASALLGGPEGGATTGLIGDSVQCTRFTQNGAGVGFYTAAAPDDLQAYVDQVAGVNDPTRKAATDLEVVGSAHGGTLYRLCATFVDEPNFDYCEIDWVDDNLLVGVFVAGLNSTDVDLSAARTALVERLPELVDGIAATS